MITKPQARTIFDALVDSDGRLPTRIDMRIYRALVKNGWSEWRAIPLSNGLVGGAQFVTQAGYEAAEQFYDQSLRGATLRTAWSNLRLRAGR